MIGRHVSTSSSLSAAPASGGGGGGGSGVKDATKKAFGEKEVSFLVADRLAGRSVEERKS